MEVRQARVNGSASVFMLRAGPFRFSLTAFAGTAPNSALLRYRRPSMAGCTGHNDTSKKRRDRRRRGNWARAHAVELACRLPTVRRETSLAGPARPPELFDSRTTRIMTDSSEKSAVDAAAVPKPVVGRLSLYLRELQHLLQSGIATTSSTQLGTVLGFSDTQVRKDLAYVGQFGYPGIGYRCEELIPEIKKVLGTDRSWQVILVGLGNLGRALLRYRGFADQGFTISAVFDVDADKIGHKVEGVAVLDWAQMSQYVRTQQIRLAIIAVPAGAAQDVANKLVEAGIEGILNFAPTALSLPASVSRVEVDLAIELEQLSFLLVNRPKQD